MSTAVKVGRSSTIYTTEAVLEVSAFAGNRPTIRKVVGVDMKTGSPKTVGLSFTAELSGGKNGRRTFELSPGFYMYDDVLGTGSRKYKGYVEISEDHVADLDDDEVEETLSEYFPLEIQTYFKKKTEQEHKTKIANEILAKIAVEREEYAEFVQDGLIAVPEFKNPPTTEMVVRDMECGEGFSEDEYIVLHGEPTHYVVSKPIFAKGHTPQEAIASAMEVIESRKKNLEEAKKETAGLPALTGTERQIAWAVTLRADYAKKHPETKVLKTATTAKYWIDNRATM